MPQNIIHNYKYFMYNISKPYSGHVQGPSWGTLWPVGNLNKEMWLTIYVVRLYFPEILFWSK